MTSAHMHPQSPRGGGARRNPRAHCLNPDVRCPSDEHHQPASVVNHVTHYLSCVPLRERASFWTLEHQVWRHEHRVQLAKLTSVESARVRAARETAKVQSRSRPDAAGSEESVAMEQMAAGEPRSEAALAREASQRVFAKMTETALEIRLLYSRAKLIREDLGCRTGLQASSQRYRDPKRIEQGSQDAQEEWEAIDAVIQRQDKDSSSLTDTRYDVEKDFSVCYMQFIQKSANGIDRPFEPDFVTPVSTAGFGSLNTPAIETLPSRRVNRCHLEGSFPNQTVPLSDLLQHEHREDYDECILDHKSKKDRIRYIHIPCNNMEKVIAKYYRKESKLDDGPFADPLQKSRPYMLLRPQFWRGQQRGMNRGHPYLSSLAVHTRHMRPMCESISSDPPHMYHRKADAMALYAPFLHWEYDRYRGILSRCTEQVLKKQREARAQANAETEMRRVIGRLERSWPLPSPPADTRGSSSGVFGDMLHRWHTTRHRARRTDNEACIHHERTFQPNGEKIMDAASRETRAIHVAEELLTPGGLPIKNKLGRYLIHAANLYETITLYRDQKMLEKYLITKEGQYSLHPRRTLGQWANWSPEIIKSTDRDQTVYQGTAMDPNNAHNLMRMERGILGEPQGLHLKTKPSRIGSLGNYRTGSAGNDQRLNSSYPEFVYGQCLRDVRKVPRLVMVDQLWMWILDKNTIITSFACQYGKNRDPSGVFQTIKMRLQSGTIKIRSVYDLALVILRECNASFLDRSRPHDSRPQVMDIFATAIGRIDHKLSVQNASLESWTKSTSNLHSFRYLGADKANPYTVLLDVHRETALQKEIRDILRDLTRIIAVQRQQKEFIDRFVPIAKASILGSSEEGPSLPHEAPDVKIEDVALEAQYASFSRHASYLRLEMDDIIRELESLKSSAERTLEDVLFLLNLKQQQASLLHAWQSVKQGAETVGQSRSIMMFTVVTIFFLPLSFLSSIFGMNNATFADDNNLMSLDHQLVIIFMVSSAIIMLAVWFAFSKWLRTLLWALYRVCATRVMAWLPLYRLKLEPFNKMTSERLVQWADQEVELYQSWVEMTAEISRRKQELLIRG
ncbi:hypothetical protein ACKVWM_003580 [Pyricularia oryzae]